MVRSFDWLPSQVSLSNPGLMESNKCHDRNNFACDFESDAGDESLLRLQ